MQSCKKLNVPVLYPKGGERESKEQPDTANKLHLIS